MAGRKIKINLEIEVDLNLFMNYTKETNWTDTYTVREDIVEPLVADIEHKTIDDEWIVKVVRATQLLEKPFDRRNFCNHHYDFMFRGGQSSFHKCAKCNDVKFEKENV